MRGIFGLTVQQQLMTSAAAIVIVASASPALAQTRTFDVPAGPASRSIPIFARQAGVQILASGDTVKSKRTKAVKGKFTVEDALRLLLEGTNLAPSSPAATGIITIRSRQEGNGAPSATNREPAQKERADNDIVVTGTHIRGANPTAPIHVITRVDIERSGYSNVGDVIRSLPENYSGGQNPGVVAAPSVNFNNTNSSTVNLRGLGTDATLVLVNGRRLASDALGQAPDISAIPLAAIERVEIVTDGSSAIYGSDAVAGVANFILKTNYNGADLRARVGGATQGGGLEQVYSAFVGKSASNWHAMAGIQYSDRDEIRASQRSFTSGVPSDHTLIRPEQRTVIIASAGAELGPRISISLDGMWNEQRSTLTDHYSDLLPGFPGKTSVKSYSLAGGLKANLWSDWSFRVDVGNTESRPKSMYDYTNPAGYIYRTEYRNSTKFLDGVFAGSLLSMPGGELKIAIGGGRREQQFKWSTSTGAPFKVQAEGSHNVNYLFAEAQIPLVGPTNATPGIEALDINISGRSEDYSDLGSATTPKVGIRYVPIEGLTLRGTWGKSFKAPSFFQLYSSRSAFLGRASQFGGTSGGTVIQASGGNLDLKPERSRSLTVGVEYSPPSLPSMKLKATYFNIDFTDRVVTPIPTLTSALSNANFAPFVLRNPTAAQQALIIATAPSLINGTGAPYDPASVVAIVLNYQANASAQRAQGLDVSYSQDFEFGGSVLSAFANGTWINVKQKTLPTTPEISLSGQIFQIPQFRSRGGLTWLTGGLSTTIVGNYQSGSKDTGIVPAQNISSLITFDATIAYNFSSGGSLSGFSIGLSVTNLFDQNPPYAVSPSIYATGVHYDSTNSSAIGRFASVSLKKSF